MKRDSSFDRQSFTVSQSMWILLSLLAVISPCTAGMSDGYRPGAANFRLKTGRGIGELDSLIAVYSMTLFDSISSRNTYFFGIPGYYSG